MKKLNVLIGILAGIVILGSAWVIYTKINEQPLTEEEDIYQVVSQKEATLVVDYGEGEPKTIEIDFEEGMTAFDVLEKGTGELDLGLKTKTYDMGIFIEAIGEKENGQDNKYWLYYVNEEMPQVAADKKEIKTGDKVEFKFESSPF
jgi:hypothetical protein